MYQKEEQKLYSGKQGKGHLNKVIKVKTSLAVRHTNTTYALKWCTEDTSGVVFLQTYITSTKSWGKHQTNPKWEKFYKLIDSTHQKCQDHESKDKLRDITDWRKWEYHTKCTEVGCGTEKRHKG